MFEFPMILPCNVVNNAAERLSELCTFRILRLCDGVAAITEGNP